MKFAKTPVANGIHQAAPTIEERRRAAPHAGAISLLVVDGLMTQEKIGDQLGVAQTHVATMLSQKSGAEERSEQEERPRVTPVGAKLRVLADINFMHFLEDESVASLRQSVALAEDEITATRIKKEINWRIASTTQMFELFGEPDTRGRAAKELVLLRWVEATLARRRISWTVDKKELSKQAKEAFGACAKLFEQPDVIKLFSPLMRLAFSAVISINQASAEWMLRKAEGGNLLEEAFLKTQLSAYDDALVQLTQLDRKAFRPTRALALRACLEMAVYLNAPQEQRYLKLFETHLMDARRAKTAVQWYLDNYIDEIEGTLKTSICGRPGWDALRKI